MGNREEMTSERSADSLAILIQDFSSEFSLEKNNSILHSTKQRFCQTLEGNAK